MGSALHPLPSWLLWFCPLPWGNGRCLWLRCHKHTTRLRPGDTATGGNGRAVKPMAVEAGMVMPGMRQGWRWPWGIPSPPWQPAAPHGAVTAARGPRQQVPVAPTRPQPRGQALPAGPSQPAVFPHIPGLHSPPSPHSQGCAAVALADLGHRSDKATVTQRAQNNPKSGLWQGEVPFHNLTQPCTRSGSALPGTRGSPA